MEQSKIEFVRLTRIPPEVIASHMSDPRLARHMPLLAQPWDLATARAFVATKEAGWARDGLGHWAFLARGRYVGWGGYQLEGQAWDLGIVLKPSEFGLGAAIVRKCLAFARADPRIPFATFLLPPSRSKLGASARLGARRQGEILHGGQRFVKYRLDTGG